MRPIIVIKGRNIVAKLAARPFLAAGLLCCASFLCEVAQSRQASTVLDLTAKTPSTEQGFPGIPGRSFSGGSAVKGDTRDDLPLELRVTRVTRTDTGDFVLEVSAKNIGTHELDLPRLRNLSLVETPGNRSQRILFFRIQVKLPVVSDPIVLGFAAVGSSASLQDSFVKLAPQQQITIRLLTPQKSMRQAMNLPSTQLSAIVSCEEWQLEDTRYFIRANSETIFSKNSVDFSSQNGEITGQLSQ
jgi:hypothetical protein